jgi:hypothetical protein
VVKTPKAGRDVDLPEEEAVIAGLGKRLGIAAVERKAVGVRARRELEGLERRIATLSKKLEAARAAELGSYRDCAGELLARWPVLDDPWNPAYSQTLASERAAISEHLQTSAAYARHQRAVDTVAAVDAELWKLRIEAAPWENLVRSIHTVELARTLAERGGAEWKHYQGLLACERTVPRAP